MNLGEAHRKHAFQLMANELKISHVLVSSLYMGLQMVIFIGALVVLTVAYVAFMKKYYHLHQAYLDEIKRLRK